MQLEVSGLDWDVCEGQADGGGDIINCWCQLKDNTTIHLRIEDWPNHYYWQLPTDYDWDASDCLTVHTVLKKCLNANAKHLMPYVPEDFVHKTVYYYDSEPTPMIRFRFSTNEAARHASNILKKGILINNDRIHGDVIEYGTVDVIMKLLTEVNISHCSWFTCIGKPVPKGRKISTLEQEYFVSYRSIVPSNCTLVPRPLICAFDIEEYSHNHNAFPDAWCSEDDINMISVTFKRDGSPVNTWTLYVVVVCDYIIEEPNEDCTVIEVKDRIALIYKFAELVQKHNPDLFTGYNILQFDIKHMDAKLGIWGKEMPNLGRLIGNVSKISNLCWSSSACKAKDMYIPKAPGRPFVDFYEHCMRSEHWPVYNLSYACSVILADFPELRKKGLPAKEQFRIYKAVMDTDHLPRTDETRIVALKDMGKFIMYCKFDSTSVLHMSRVTHWWIGMREMCNVVGVGPQTLLTNGQQRRVVNLMYRACTKRNIVINKRVSEPFYYEGGLVQEPVMGVHDLSPTYDFKSLYPSIMISYNTCATTLIHPKNWHKYTPDQYTAASLLIGDKDIDGDGEMDEKKLKPSDVLWEEAEFRFLKSNVKQGVIPQVLVGLLAERARVRKIKSDDPIQIIVNNQRQLALKVCSNSVYGCQGVKKNGKLPCIEIAATTTFFGRDRITYTINWIIANSHRLITEWYNSNGYELTPHWVYSARMIYGDTDSCMMVFDGVPLKYIHALSHYIGNLATKEHSHLGPLELEMEGIYKILCVKQKHYCKFTYNDPSWGKPDVLVSENGVAELTVKGLTPVRRDSCALVKTTIFDILFSAMTGGTYDTIMGIFLRTVRLLYQNKVNVDQLVVTKGLGAHYKSETATMKVFAEQMAKRGQTINPGERHEYIVVDVPGQDKISMKMILLSLYNSIEPNKRPRIDSKYYFNNLLKKKVDVLFGAIFAPYMKEMAAMTSSLCGKVVTGATPGKMLFGTLQAKKCEPFMLMSRDSKQIAKFIAAKDERDRQRKLITADK